MASLIAFWIAGLSSVAPSPFAPQSKTLMTSARRSGIVLAVGAPVAANLKFAKVVSACAVRDGVNAKALTAPPNNTLRRMICGLIIHLLSAFSRSRRVIFGVGRASVGNGAALLTLVAVVDAFG